MTKLPKYADQLGFILIYPTTTKETNCWDCHSNKTLAHDGGGDSQGLVNMVKYALNKYNGDPAMVFSVGGSSGAMMTNVLAATYPDVFNAGASWSGVPAACWYGSPISTPASSDLSCPMARKTYNAQQWGDIARGCYPGYNGTRTRMLIVHGTQDQAVLYPLLGMQLEQWSNVLGVIFTKNMTNTPAQSWTEMTYGDGTKLLVFSVQGAGHIPPFQEETVLNFFGIK
jgi:acetylxylan esterase